MKLYIPNPAGSPRVMLRWWQWKVNVKSHSDSGHWFWPLIHLGSPQIMVPFTLHLTYDIYHPYTSVYAKILWSSLDFLKCFVSKRGASFKRWWFGVLRSACLDSGQGSLQLCMSSLVAGTGDQGFDWWDTILSHANGIGFCAFSL